MDFLLTIEGKRVILNVQYSKIGCSYPRLFIEFSENEYVNYDVFLNAEFKMKKDDFNDWLVDAKPIPEESYEETLREFGINYKKLKDALKG